MGVPPAVEMVWFILKLVGVTLFNKIENIEWTIWRIVLGRCIIQSSIAHDGNYVVRCKWIVVFTLKVLLFSCLFIYIYCDICTYALGDVATVGK